MERDIIMETQLYSTVIKKTSPSDFRHDFLEIGREFWKTSEIKVS